MPVEIDIKTRVIEDDHRVLIARPGAKYRLHNDFQDRNFVGVELPGLFEQGEAIAFDDEKIVARVRRSLEIRKWILTSREGPAPDFNLRAYDNAGTTPSIRQYLRIIRYYCLQVKRGDLVLNPPPTFNSRVFIGEIGARHAPRLYHVDFYGEFALTGVPIAWVGNIAKRDLPSNALEALRKPSALFAVGPDFRDKIYAAAYGNFIYRGKTTSTFATTSERYGAVEELVFQAFLNSVAINLVP